MNCRQFQDHLFDYLDGSLSQKARTEAEQHLSECVACREKLKEERQVAQVIGGSFRRTTESLELSPVVARRVLAELAKEAGAACQEKGSLLFWHRLAWPLAVAASLLLVLSVWLTLPRRSGSGDLHAQRRASAGEISVQLSYVVPTYTFRLEGGFVTDALSYHTNVVNETLPAPPARSQ